MHSTIKGKILRVLNIKLNIKMAIKPMLFQVIACVVDYFIPFFA